MKVREWNFCSSPLLAPEDEGGSSAAPTEAAPDDGGDDDMVTLPRAEIEKLYASAKNSAWADARKHFGKQKQQPSDDPRVKRGLELLERYETAKHEAALEQVDRDARMEPFQEKVMSALSNVRIRPPGYDSTRHRTAPAPAQQPAQQGSRLERMFEMFLESQLAEKMPKAPVSYASNADQIRGEINASIADIPEDDPKRHERVQKTVLDRLKTVHVQPTPKQKR